MIEARAIKYKDGTVRKIETCSFCGCKYWDIEQRDYICYELHITKGYDRKSKSVLIRNLNGIKKNCPLSIYDRVRRHTAKEKPVAKNDIIIETKEERTGGLKTGFCVKETGQFWSMEGRRIKDEDIIGWWYHDS